MQPWFLRCSITTCSYTALHDDDVNPVSGQPPLRQAQIAHTEQRIIAAATELFLADGYVATTLEAVARRARVGARTVYVRFGTKAALFKRVVDVAIVGDTQPVDVLGRDWMRAALTAPTAAERIAASAAAGRQIMARTGALFAVAQQAAAVEPLIAGFWQQGREQIPPRPRRVLDPDGRRRPARSRPSTWTG